MQGFLFTFVAVFAAVFIACRYVTGVHVRRPGTIAIVALVFAFLNVFLGWFLKVALAVVLAPLALITFGLPYLLFGWLFNMLALWITDKILGDFEIDSFGALASAAGIVSCTTWLLGRLVAG